MLTAEQAQSLAREQFERLAEGKPWGLMRLGLLAAIAAEDIFDVVNAAILGDGILSPYLARQTAQSLAYYSDPQEWRCEFLDALGVPVRRIVTIETIYACWLAGNVQIQPSDWAHGRRLAAFARRKIDTDVLELDGPAIDNIDWAEALKREPIVWFFRTAIPCWILHGRWPWRMLSEVTAGSRHAMRSVVDLIRIDKRAIHLPAIAAFLHDGPAHLVSGRLKKAGDALRSRPRKIKRSKVKYRLGRFIQDVGERFGFRLKQPQVDELFRCARLMRHGELADPDLAVGASMTRALNHERHHWDLPPGPDIKTLERVRELRGLFG